jgi:glycerol-3-phosphate O-acyltransferase
MIKSKWISFKKEFRALVYLLLQGTHNHYLCRLPDRLDYVSSAFLRLFYSGVTVSHSQIDRLKLLNEKGIIVFATKYRLNFELLFYHIRYKRMGLPYPDFGFDFRIFFWQPITALLRMLLAKIDFFLYNLRFPSPYRSGYIRDQMLNGRVGFLSLIDKRSFYRRFVKEKTDPVQHLIEIQQGIGRPIFIVPQLIFFSRNPDRAFPGLFDILFGTKANPGLLRRMLVLFINPKSVFVEVSEPLNLQEYLLLPENLNQTPENIARLLRRKLLVQINRHRQSITGPVLKSREEIKENILTSDRLQKFMSRYADSRHMPRQQVHKEADGYLEEIAADYSTGFVKIGALAVRKLIGLMFEEVFVNTDVLEQVRRKSRRGPLILLPCHKSHIDYLILSYILYIHNLPVPHIAAGKNLSFWPMGALFRAGGAFFIRRSFRGAMLYSRVFSEYIYKLLEEGFNLEFFLEGTRSRSGKLIMPKLGLLSILLNAFRNGACEDMIFVPVFIGYDRVLEEGAYLQEIEGGQKKPESLLQVIKARKFLKHRHGRIYIQFHEPISLNSLLLERGCTLSDMTPKDQNAFCRGLAFRVLNAIDKMTLVTPQALFASAVLNCPKARFSYDQLLFYWDTYLGYLTANGVPMADSLAADPAQAVHQLLETHISRKFIEKLSEEKEEFDRVTWYRIVENRRPILEYYRNNCIGFFVPPAFTSLAILTLDTFQFTLGDLTPGYLFLQEFFRNEFVYEEDKPAERLVAENVSSFTGSGILLPHPTLKETYNITSAGLRKLKAYSSFMRAYFESYWIVLNYFMRSPQDATDPKERLKKIQGIGNRMYKRNEVELKEALSRINYDNAVGYFLSNGVKGSENTEQIERYSDHLQKHLNHLSP